jgi:hypothetical protein
MNKAAASAIISREKSHGLAWPIFCWQHIGWAWCTCGSQSRCAGAARLCAIAQLGRNAGTVRRGRGACADLLPASSVVDYGAGSRMRRGGTAMGDRCRGQHGEGVARPQARW